MSDPLAYLDNSDAFDQRERQQRVQGQLKRVDPAPRRKPSAAEDLRTLQRKAPNPPQAANNGGMHYNGNTPPIGHAAAQGAQANAR